MRELGPFRDVGDPSLEEPVLLEDLPGRLEEAGLRSPLRERGALLGTSALAAAAFGTPAFLSSGCRDGPERTGSSREGWGRLATGGFQRSQSGRS